MKVFQKSESMYRERMSMRGKSVHHTEFSVSCIGDSMKDSLDRSPHCCNYAVLHFFSQSLNFYSFICKTLISRVFKRPQTHSKETWQKKQHIGCSPPNVVSPLWHQPFVGCIFALALCPLPFALCLLSLSLLVLCPFHGFS